MPAFMCFFLRNDFLQKSQLYGLRLLALVAVTLALAHGVAHADSSSAKNFTQSMTHCTTRCVTRVAHRKQYKEDRRGSVGTSTVTEPPSLVCCLTWHIAAEPVWIERPMIYNKTVVRPCWFAWPIMQRHTYVNRCTQNFAGSQMCNSGKLSSTVSCASLTLW